MSNLTHLSRRSFLLMSLALAACKTSENTLNITGSTMGTTYNVVAVDKTGAVEKAAATAKIEAALAQVNQQMSNWDPGRSTGQPPERRSIRHHNGPADRAVGLWRKGSETSAQ